MHIKSLSVLNYRNLQKEDINFNSRLNIFVGENGQGKTNLLEAIYLLTEGESFRYVKNENLLMLGKKESYLSAKIFNKNLDFDLFLKIENNNKKLFINDKPTKSLKNLDFYSVLFSPESLNVIKDSSDARRNLLDQLVSHTSTTGYKVISEYKKILKTRNKLLRDILEENLNYQIGVDTLESLNKSFLLLATELTNLRISALKKIKPDIDNALNKVDEKFKPTFNFKYLISDVEHQTSSEDAVHFCLQNRMKELEKIELKSGISLVGPQKHDVIFLYNGNDSRFFCSQGQQRSIILAYKMAQIVYHHRVHGFYPLLLLDDVLSELDLPKQESLISTLNQTETQTFVTTTDISLLSKLSLDKAEIFKIKNGQIVI